MPDRRTRRRFVACLIVAVSVGAGACACSSDDPGDPGGASAAPTSTPSSPSASSATSATSATSVIEGRWEQEHTCQQLVDGLDAAGLAALAPGVVGDYFPDQTPQQLARKADVCSGAEPQRHAHFFTADGAFGSLDQDGQQVDDGSYEVSGDTLTIAEGEFRYRVDGDTLVLEPVIREADRQLALATPLEFSTAGWQVSVAYDGLAFTRVPCDGWC